MVADALGDQITIGLRLDDAAAAGDCELSIGVPVCKIAKWVGRDRVPVLPVAL